MTLADGNFMGRVHHNWDADSDPQDRLQRMLEAGYRGRPSALAQDLGVPKKTAENLLAGHWPGPTTFAAIVRRFGADAWQALFAPELDPIRARLIQEEREAEERLADLRKQRRQVEGGLSGPSDRLVAPERRSFRS